MSPARVAESDLAAEKRPYTLEALKAILPWILRF